MGLLYDYQVTHTNALSTDTIRITSYLYLCIIHHINSISQFCPAHRHPDIWTLQLKGKNPFKTPAFFKNMSLTEAFLPLHPLF